MPADALAQFAGFGRQLFAAHAVRVFIHHGNAVILYVFAA